MHDYSVCKWFIIAYNCAIWLWVMEHSFRSFAIPVVQWGEEENTSALTNCRQLCEQQKQHSGGIKENTEAPVMCEAVCVCAWMRVSCVCGTASECVCICKHIASMFVPLNACGNVLVTIGIDTTGPKFSPEQRLSSSFWHFFSSSHFLLGQKRAPTLQWIETFREIGLFVSCQQLYEKINTTIICLITN